MSHSVNTDSPLPPPPPSNILGQLEKNEKSIQQVSKLKNKLMSIIPTTTQIHNVEIVLYDDTKQNGTWDGTTKNDNITLTTSRKNKRTEDNIYTSILIPLTEIKVIVFKQEVVSGGKRRTRSKRKTHHKTQKRVYRKRT